MLHKGCGLCEELEKKAKKAAAEEEGLRNCGLTPEQVSGPSAQGTANMSWQCRNSRTRD